MQRHGLPGGLASLTERINITTKNADRLEGRITYIEQMKMQESQQIVTEFHDGHEEKHGCFAKQVDKLMSYNAIPVDLDKEKLLLLLKGIITRHSVMMTRLN